MYAMNMRTKKTSGRTVTDRIAITSGDPVGIGPEIVLKAFKTLPNRLKRKIVLFGDPDCFRALDHKLKTGIDISLAGKSAPPSGSLAVEPVKIAGAKLPPFGRPSALCGKIAMASVTAAAKAVMAGSFGALVTAPISKESVKMAGYDIPGHTEYLAKLAGAKDVAMTLASSKLAVTVVTTHMPLAEVPEAITKEKIVSKIKIVYKALKKYGVQNPRIAVCGLNPHASDGGAFGNEEKMIIAPAIALARKSRIKVTGPHPADSLFSPKLRDSYDIAIAMYHDQGLVAVKALSFGETVNVTLGLPYLRVSVDHGTAFDIAGKNRADEKPMVFAIKSAFSLLEGKWL